jgi:hypothetical protein
MTKLRLKKQKLVHQKDGYGCGLACLANLLKSDYDSVKKDWEKDFYKLEKATYVADVVKFLNSRGLNYKSKFFNQNKKYEYKKEEAKEFSKIENAIILIFKNEIYPAGHYLLRVKNGWVDPWFNYPSIDNVHAGIRKELPGNVWYVIYPENQK